jgi:cysteine sulfinate desulfinase/cysteine desulfurase-like protein
MGFDAGLAGGALRCTVGAATSEADVDAAAAAINRAVTRLGASAGARLGETEVAANL